ncbi:MAG: hypothetical protein Q4Q17_00580 [Tissierellia bacterium]|nr:hypothetical protein [Tissierellia bacterium]
MLRKLSSIGKMEFRYHIFLPLCLTVVLLGAIAFLFGIGNLRKTDEILIVERLLPLMGIILMGSIFRPEDSESIDVLRLRKTSIVSLWGLRWAIRWIIFGLLLALYCFLIRQKSGQLEFLPMWMHALSIGTLVGGATLFLQSIRWGEILSYMLILFYMIIQWMLDDRILRVFYLYTWSKGRGGRDAYYLLIGGTLNLCAIFIHSRRK